MAAVPGSGRMLGCRVYQVVEEVFQKLGCELGFNHHLGNRSVPEGAIALESGPIRDCRLSSISSLLDQVNSTALPPPTLNSKMRLAPYEQLQRSDLALRDTTSACSVHRIQKLLHLGRERHRYFLHGIMTAVGQNLEPAVRVIGQIGRAHGGLGYTSVVLPNQH